MLSMVAQTCSPSAGVVETGGSLGSGSLSKLTSSMPLRDPVSKYKLDSTYRTISEIFL